MFWFRGGDAVWGMLQLEYLETKPFTDEMVSLGVRYMNVLNTQRSEKQNYL